MTTKRIKITKLQPTDTIRETTINFYESLSKEEFKKRDIPEVGNFNGVNYISDGNNYSAFLARKRYKKIKVNYKTPNDESHIYFDLDNLERDAQHLQSQGVYNPHHLWDVQL